MPETTAVTVRLQARGGRFLKRMKELRGMVAKAFGIPTTMLGTGHHTPGPRAAYRRRIGTPRSPLSCRHRAGSRANKHRRTVPTFASDRRNTR